MNAIASWQNRLGEAWRVLGPAGAIGLLVLLFGVPFYLAAVQPVKGELRAQQTVAEQVRTGGDFSVFARGGQTYEHLDFNFDSSPFKDKTLREEMASAVLFLASDDSSFMTASTFLVDGGISGAYVTPL